MSTKDVNPMKTNGFEFLEFSSPNPEKLHQQFIQLGFKPVAKHRNKNVTLYRQGQINFVINQEPNSPAKNHADQHGAAACAMGFRVHDADYAFHRAIQL